MAVNPNPGSPRPSGSSSTLPQLQQHPHLPTRGLILGHRRSNSYGHHRALTATTSLNNNIPLNGALSHLHRRTGSSVIETLQTLACNSGNGAEGEGRSREESIAQFLENLKKEQQEK